MVLDHLKILPSSSRFGGFFCALLLGGSLITLQTLIGGRGLLFLYPGLTLVAIAALVGAALTATPKARPDLVCLGAAVIFCGYIFIRAVASPSYFSRPDLFSVVGALVVYGLTATVVTSTSTRSAIIAALLGFALLHVLVGFIQFNRGDNFMLISFLQRADYGQRASGLYVCPNHLAGLLEVLGIFGISFVCWSRWSVLAKFLVAYATAVCYVGLALTGSRGGYLSAIASIIVFAAISLLLLRAAHRRRWWKFAAAGGAAVALLLITGSVVLRGSSFLSARAGNIADTQNMRIELWRAALKQWQLQPVFGTGSGTYRFYGREFREKEMQNDPVDVHNDYLHLLCEYGAVGAVAFLLFFGAHARKGFRNIRHSTRSIGAGGRHILSNRLALSLGAISAIAAYVVHSVFDFNLHIPANAALMAFVFALVANPENTHRLETARRRPVLASRLMLAVLGVILFVQCVRLFRGEYYCERARVALRDEDPISAIEFAKKSRAHDPSNPEVWGYLARALVARAHQLDSVAAQLPFYDEGILAYKKAQELAPLDGSYPLDLATTYDLIGRFDEAEEMYSLARARDPNSRAVAQLYRAHIEFSRRSRSAQTESM